MNDDATKRIADAAVKLAKRHVRKKMGFEGDTTIQLTRWQRRGVQYRELFKTWALAISAFIVLLATLLEQAAEVIHELMKSWKL